MFSNRFHRRGFQDAPWEEGPWQPRPYGAGPQDNWYKPSWEHQPWRGKHNRHPPGPWKPWPFPGPSDFYRMDGDRRWKPQDCPRPPPPWDYREEHQRQEENFTEDSYPVQPLFAPDSFTWSEFPGNEHPSADFSWEQGAFQESCPPWRPRGPSHRRCRYIRHVQQETLVYHSPAPPQLPKGKQASSKSSQSCPQESQPGGKGDAQSLAAPQPASASKDSVQSGEKVAEGLPAASGKVPEPSGPAASPQKSPAADPQAVEQEPAAGARLVEPEDRQKAAGSQSPGPSALKTEPALPENTCTRTEEDLGAGRAVQPKHPLRPQQGAGSPPHSTSAPQEPVETAGAAASLGVEVSPGAAEEPDAQQSQASSNVCSEPAASPRTGHPPGDGTELAAGCQPLLCSMLPAPSPASTDLRSAAVLARKEEIELSYQQFSLTIAVVATMLLEKEPSMEAALGLALRANLRQVRTHHLQELEDFINSYDSGTPSP
nr:microtubule-associated protein tau isoform X1 [Anas platyrhynchos]XP_038024350.1 microtubule-associated protein tau isoform X1 [Anas platyrhynchos]XP_038024351.1 microtubule-associated protein tau isoform X1 [Anas platyrhynchos]XP_038024352.1 microtubule-associated protein tau isoform X1 [Anas platyrhynchos]XP_038024353.1 microtubule-associated protein tau isoform X1 [Anas platyrhynchos]XP_038024354.1 microtubule-associated protein tau isoform X1 [Anas platyrhynchos]